MLILFDHSTPAPLASCLTEHIVTKAKDRGWDRLTNGDLLAEAERANIEKIAAALNAATPGSYAEVAIPLQVRPRR
jgi:hypothetical protein